ncbi:MAG: hypothetical protein GY835_00945 [bacterium]|nr:hypothetical protein [bacterium]
MRKFAKVLQMILVGVAGLGVALPVCGETIVVPDDYSTIQVAIFMADGGDTVQVGPGIYTGTYNRDLDLQGKELVITGAGTGETTIDCANTGRGFIFKSGESRSAVVEGFTIINAREPDGEYGGGILCENSSPTLRDLNIESCRAERGGGFACLGGSPLLENIIIAENIADGLNGTTYCGGGLYCTAGATPLLRNVVITGNIAEGELNSRGGGLCIENGARPILENVEILFNHAGQGGGLDIDNGSVDWSEGRLEGNESWSIFGSGGGLNCRQAAAPLSLTRLDIVGNSTLHGYGGGLCFREMSALANLTRLNIWDNYCESGDGAGLYLSDNTVPVQMSNSFVAYNLAGGGIHTAGSDQLELTCNNIWDNGSGNYGGDIGDQTGLDGNLSGDPLFCEPLGSRNLVSAYSPLLPANNLCGVVIGVTAREVGCSYILEIPTWFAGIQDAIDVATPGDTIRVLPGTYSGPRNVNLDLHGMDLTLVGTGGADATVIDCAGAENGIHLHEGETNATLIQGFTITGAGSAAIDCDGAAPTLRFLKLNDNEGYGVRCQDGDPILEDMIFTGNKSAAVKFESSSPHLARMDFSDNHSSCVLSFSNGSNPLLEDCTFIGNITSSGVVFCSDGELTLNGGYFHANVGTVIYARGSDATLNLDHVTMVDNSFGGILCDSGAAVTMTRSTLTDCGGYAIEIRSDSVANLSQVITAFNRTWGIVVWAGGTLISDCSNVYGNSSGDYGGGVADPTGSDGNIMTNPLFCQTGGPESPPTISVNSPCAPANNACGLLMGAHEPVCDLAEFTIAGTISDSEGSPLPGVTVSGLYYPVETGADGSYEFIAAEGWAGTLLPNLDNYHFAPSERIIAPLTGDLSAQDFLAYMQTLIRVPVDFASIGAALDFAETGDTVFVAPGIYSGPENRNLGFQGKDIILISEAGSANTIIDCEGVERGFLFQDSESAAALVSGFTIRDGRAEANLPQNASGGGISIYRASPTLADLVIQGCIAAGGNGGGIYLQEAPCTITDLVLKGNQAPEFGGKGGGLACNGCSPNIDGLLVTDNYCFRYGGGIWVEGGAAHFSRCTIVGNSAGWSGGAIASDRNMGTLFSQTLIAFNSATSGGALCYLLYNAPPDYECVDIYGNTDPFIWWNADDPLGENGNFAADPHFCDPGNGDYRLAADSPCLPANNDCGLQIGYFGQGCPPGAREGVPDINADAGIRFSEQGGQR